jgi:hypothetical protein
MFVTTLSKAFGPSLIGNELGPAKKSIGFINLFFSGSYSLAADCEVFLAFFDLL